MFLSEIGKMEEINELIAKAKGHNEAVDTFVNVTLKEHFGGDIINAAQWFEAQQLIRQQNFYGRGIEILNALRSKGIDAKMNMQADKICLPIEYIKGVENYEVQ